MIPLAMNPFFRLCIPLLLLALLVPGALAQEKKKPKSRTLDYAGRRIADLSPDRTIVYKEVGGRELKLHVFLPEGWKPTDRRACFHIIHGGGWAGMDPSRMYPFAADFVKKHGMVGICPEYRLYKADKSVTVFDCVKDARSSVRYVRGHAEELGIDPAKIIVSGASAGGHLAAAAALFDGVDEEGEDTSVSCRPDAMVLYFPVIDTSAEGYGQKKIGDRWKELSPAHNVRAGLPPTITFHGTGDTVTPFQGAQDFHEAMLAAGNSSKLVVTEGGAHGYLMRTQEAYDEAIVAASAFFDSLGWPVGAEWQSLFDGKTLESWHQVGDGEWVVEDGAIVGRTQEKAKLYGLLVSNREYKNVRVRFSFQSLEGNSGFYVRGHVRPPDKAHGLQVEVDPRNFTGGIYESYERGWVSKPDAALVAKAFRHDQWNEMEILADGGHVVTRLNGTKIAELKNDPVTGAGHLIMQMHSGNKMLVRFKDIRVVELDD